MNKFCDAGSGQINMLAAGLLVLRVGTGLSLAFVHGWQKLVDAAGFVFAGHEWGFVSLVRSLGFAAPAVFASAAALSESVCAVLVACGFYTRPAAGLAAATMVVAMYLNVRTGGSPEAAYLYAIPFVTLAFTGPGKLSLDGLRKTSELRSVSMSQES